MSEALFEHPDDMPDRSELSVVLSRFDQIHTDFIETTGHWASVPSEKRKDAIADKGREAVNAFYDVVCAVLEDDTIDGSSQGKVLAGLLIEAGETRASAFGELMAVYGEVDEESDSEMDNDDLLDSEDVTESHASLADLIQADIDDGADADDITGRIMNDFLCDINESVEELFATIGERPLARFFLLSEKARGHAIDLAKISAAVAIGSVASHFVIKRFDRR